MAVPCRYDTTVDMYLTSLENCSRDLAQTPDTFYQQTIKRMKNSGLAKDLGSVLPWLVHAKRFLTVKELFHAVEFHKNSVDIRSGQCRFPDMEPTPHFKRILSHLCAGIVVLDKDSNEVSLQHYTTRDYLMKFEGN